MNKVDKETKKKKKIAATKLAIIKEEMRKHESKMLLSAIMLDNNRFRMVLRILLFYLLFPFKWILRECKDWRTLLVFLIVILIIGSEVWVPYLIGIIFWSNEAVRISMFSVGSACWIFWLGPGTPFLALCIIITMGVKGAFDAIRYKRMEKRINHE